MGTGNVDGGNTVNVTNGSITGVVMGGHGTHAGEVSGNEVNVTNGTLSDNIIGGFAEDTGTASANKVTITGGALSGTTIDGGYSVNGAASGNTATVGGISFAGVVTGGRGGAGADTNKVFLKNSAGITGNAYGGRVLSGGNVTGNELTIEASGATVSGVAVGGQNDVAAGDVTDNKAYMNAGSAARLIGGVVNGVGATGKASGNRAEVSNGSSAFIAGALISDTGATGEASDNHAVVSGASAALGSIYGGITNGTGAAKDNTATISGSITANDVVGGQSVTGNAEGNKASFTQATVTNVRGARITGSGTGSAINNEATIAGGWVTGAAAGAEIQGAATGAVQDNTLTVTGGTVSGDSYGGITYGTGDAIHNGAVVSGGSTSLTNVYGGSAVSGSATKNYVTFADASAQSITAGRTGGAGAVSDNKVEMTSGSSVNGVTGGLSYGSGTVSGNKVEIKGGTVGGNILGGYNTGTGAASSNTVELTGGTINATVYGGLAGSGAADTNTVTVKKNVTGNVFGGNASGSASGNTVDLGAVTVSGSVVGGQGSTADNNTVNMNDSTVGSVISVGAAGGTGNTLTVKGTNRAGNITGFQKVSFDLSTASTTDPMLNITNGWGTSFNWGALEVSNAEQPNRLVLMQNMAGISLGSYTGAKSVSNSDDTTEFNIDTENHSSWDQRIVSESYKYRLQDTPVTPSFDPSSVYGGISKVANSTRENDITVSSGSHTNAYGGYTDVPLVGTGTTKSDRDNSYNNKITLSGGSVSGTVYGGYTWAPTGTTTNNTVNITGGSAANVVGAYSAGSATANKVNVTGGSVGNIIGSISTGGAASDNEITLGTGAVVTGYVMGGSGATATNNNKVTLEGNTAVTGIISGGSMAGTDNTLTIKGNNSAGNITNFQKVQFDLDSASNPANAMLDLTGGSTGINWAALEATGTATGARTLLSNTNGFNTFSDYTTDGTFVFESDAHEYFIDTDTHRATGATKINLDDYQFKGAVVSKAADPDDTWAGRSKRGNTTQDNTLTITGGTGTNAYGGWTSTGSTTTPHADRFDSKNNTVNLNGGSITNVYGGYTTSAGGKATGNTVNVAGGTATNVVGGESIGDATKNTVNVRSGNVTNVTGGVSTGAASDNTINLGSVYIAGNVLGGQGTVTNDNKVNVEGTTVAGSITAGSAGGTGNKLTVKSANTAGSIAGFNKVIFDTDSATTNPMLTLNGGTSFLDWQTLEATGTSAGPITLMHNGAGLSFGGTYNGAHSRSDSDDTTEFNIDTVSHTASDNDVIAESYKYRGQTNPVVSPAFAPGNVYGGISKVGNATRENEITVSSGGYTDAFGGYTEVPSFGSGKAQSSEKENSHDNKITIAGANVSGTVYGGYTTSTTGSATKNKVEVTSGTVNNIVGGYSAGGAASNNEITLKGGVTVGSVLGGQGATTTDNKVNLEGATVIGAVTGGSAGGTGHELTVRNTNAAGSLVGFGKLKFDVGTAATNPMLTLTGGASAFDWQTLEAIGTTAGPVTLMENSAGISFGGTYDGAHSGIDSADTTEFNIDTENRTASDNKVIAQSYQYRGQTNAVTSIGTDVYGGISRVANATRENNITVSSGSYTNAYGGYTDSVPPLGSDAKANSAEKNNSHDNKITIAGANVSGTVYGGYTTSTTGSATKNKVEVTSGTVNNIVGGYSAGGAASNNEITLKGGVTVGSVLGGQGATTTDNKVNLEGATVIGAVTGGSAGGTGHELTVRNTNAAGSLVGFGKLKFDVGTAATNPMLTLTGGASAFDWQTLEAIGTTAGPVTLMENSAGISFGGTYDGAHSGIDSADTTEFNIDTENRTASDNKVIAQSYQYRGQTNAVTSIGTDVYGGISRVANATRENNITVSSGSYTNAYGGYTDSVPPLPGSDAKANSAEKNNSHDNTITIAGANVSGTVYGGYTNAAAGTATKNTVNVTGGTVANVVGGSSAAGAASDNTINLGAVTVTGNVTGGEGTATNDNKVNVEGTTVNGVISGGNNATSGNTLTVKGTNSAGNITAFQHVNFDASTANAGTSMLTFTGGANALDWQTLDATGTSTTPITLMENGAGISFGGTYDGARSKINGDDTTEYNIDTENRTASDTKVIAQSYQYRGVTAPVTPSGSTDVYGGISKVGNATRENNITVSSGSYTNAYGGYTDVPLSGTDAKALSAEKNDSHDNSVTIDGATVGTVYGGYATSPTGKATKNTVNITSGTVANAVGGYSTGDAKENTVNVKSNVSGDVTGSVSTSGAASANVINLDNITVGGNVTGGSGATTEDNFIHLNKTTVTGSITGGTAASGTGNTLVVHPGVSKAQSLAGIQNINFFLDQTHDKTAPILELTTTGTQNLQGVGIGVGVIDGAHPAFRVSEQFSLIKAPGGTIQTDPTIQNTSSAMQGVSLRYEFDVAQTATNEVSAVVKKAELIEQTKSFVETRVGATAFINQGVDFLVANNIKAAKDAASAGKADEATAPKGYQLWAGIGGSHMHSETGSYVDTNGLNVGVGWAREESLKNGNVVYGPFLSYGNASYDSYLNDNTHGSGKFRTYGLGLMVRVDRKDGMWYEGSLQGGRVKSDYDGSIYAGINSSYNVSNTYWAGHFAAGKDIQLKENAKITPYLRYFWSHQGDVTAHLNTGEDYDFSEVNSHRTRLGFRYTKQSNAGGEFYTGLALEYEFSGNAHASYQGYETPSPSLKGASGMLELGYRFMPADGNMRYDLRLMGWQGKRRGLSGDLGVKWMF